jgi:hypothetical protein
MKNPPVSVRSVGSRSWTISLKTLREAEQVRERLQVGGLRCSSIERRERQFTFVADGGHLPAGPGGPARVRAWRTVGGTTQVPRT